jgi:hypothetical protein
MRKIWDHIACIVPIFHFSIFFPYFSYKQCTVYCPILWPTPWSPSLTSSWIITIWMHRSHLCSDLSQKSPVFRLTTATVRRCGKINGRVMGHCTHNSLHYSLILLGRTLPLLTVEKMENQCLPLDHITSDQAEREMAALFIFVNNCTLDRLAPEIRCWTLEDVADTISVRNIYKLCNWGCVEHVGATTIWKLEDMGFEGRNVPSSRRCGG